MIKKTDSGWCVDIQPGGRGSKRFRKTFKIKADAIRWQSWVENQVRENPDWQPKRRDTRKLSEIIDLWNQLHGHQLRSDQYRSLKCLCEGMSNPTVDKLTPKLFTDYRALRVASGISLNSVNREHAYLRAMFNELIRLGHWHHKNSVSSVRQFSVSDAELQYLSHDQIAMLLEELKRGRNLDAYKVALLCLATGSRWSEAETLRAEFLSVAIGLVTFIDTKSGRNRSIPISKELANYLKGANYGRLFKGCYAAFRNAMTRSEIKLPSGQLTHVLRHTFASHFVINGGNILTLQRVLGHSSLIVTMRYAHLAPDHLQEARQLNPVAALTYC